MLGILIELGRGDVVRLKSGGPEMTVVGYAARNRVACCWIGEGLAIQVADFDVQCLNVVRKAKVAGVAIVAGDAVRLKSGGPVMSVMHVEEDAVHCTWQWGDAGNVAEHKFKPAVLAKAGAEPVAVRLSPRLPIDEDGSGFSTRNGR